MPWGLVVLGGFTYIVFRRARVAGRNSFGWVLILWAVVFGFGIVAACVGYAAELAGAPFEVIPATALSGMLAGAALTTWAAGRSVNRRSEQNPVSPDSDARPPGLPDDD
jgi:hypothetical protein